MATHWMPDLTADKPTIGVCGKTGWVSMHLELKVPGMEKIQNVTCPKCLMIAVERAGKEVQA